MVSTETFVALQKNTQNIRNICILAHVDHGKTTLSDSLLASNGIISQKSSGKVRYLDSRPDEQLRGITMKSSAISLFFKHINAASIENDYLINLIDSPGHVDFSSEVSTASRLCDGALVLVDALEGVCSQTHTVLRQAWLENVKPILVINKIDRLITQLKLSPAEAYIHLKQIIEQVNAITATMFTQDLIDEDTRNYEEEGNSLENVDWHLEDRDDSHLYFSPEHGNVVFASAIDGWAFRIDQFATLYAIKLKINAKMLTKVLWGEWYFDARAKRVVGPKGLHGRNLKPMFVQFVLDNIWQVYDSIVLAPDRVKTEKIVQALGLKVNQRDLKSKDSKVILNSVMSSWMPISTAILLSVVEKLPSPLEAQRIRLPVILEKTNRTVQATSPLHQSIYACDSGEGAPVVAYISKIIGVPTKELPSLKFARAQQSAEEMIERRLKYLEALKEKELDRLNSKEIVETYITPSESSSKDSPPEESESETLIGFARIYAGTIRVGHEIFILGPKYDPAKPDQFCTKMKVDHLYLLMGRELQELDHVPAGNIFGINLDGLPASGILKTATLSSSLECPSFGSLALNAKPIVRVALEPHDPGQMSQLVEGLRLLNQSDPCVQVILQSTGEHVILTAGELHLERCLKDLRERFAKIEIQVSNAIVPFRERIISKPAVASTSLLSFLSSNFGSLFDRVDDANKDTGLVSIWTPNRLCCITLKAIPLTQRLIDYLISNETSIREVADGESSCDDLLAKIADTLAKGRGDIDNCLESSLSTSFTDMLWDFGPKGVGTNVLLNRMECFKHKLWGAGTRTIVNDDYAEGLDACEEMGSEGSKLDRDIRQVSVESIQSSINSGFQLATQSGPLCAEPMMGVCIILEDVAFNISDDTDILQLGLLPGQIISTVKDACKIAFMQWSSRLMTAMYSCELQAPSDVLGKVYAVIAKRKGRIISEEMRDGTSFFNIKSIIPVVESLGISEDLWKKTSGSATPQLLFHSFEVLDQDPFWVPTTNEELEDLGGKADRDNQARKYLDSIRRRKGLFVEKKVIEHAEKQKTMKQK